VPVNVNTQALPSTETVKFAGVPTVWAQCAAVSVVARASGALAIEIAERVETAITNAKKWWSARRATRLKVAILAAQCISTST
jgi:hypothetical protein